MAWHNADMPMDTNDDGRVSSIDALVAINELNTNGAHDVDASVPAPGLIDVDANGVVSAADALQIINFLNSGQGEDHHKVQVRLEVTEIDSEEVLTSVNANDEFLLRVYVQDVTEAAQGVFAAYVDVTYNEGLADVTGDIQHCRDFSEVPISCLAFEYPNGIASPSDPDSVNNVSVDGVLNEIGGFASSLAPLGANERLLLSIPMTAENVSGTLTFSGDPSDVLPAHEINLYGDNVGVADDEIEFLNTSVQVIGDAVVPVAVADNYPATEDDVLTINAAGGLLANDFPAAGVTAQIVNQPTNGTLDLNANGSFSYTPDLNFNGEDTFMYVSTNGTQSSAAATVTINVEPVNDAPTAVNDTYETTVNTTLIRLQASEGLLVNDFDVDGDEVSIPVGIVTVGPSHGTLTIGPSGGFSYIPDADFVGIDTFTYMNTDGTLESAPGTVTISVSDDGSNNAPIAREETFTTKEDIALNVAAPGVLANDSDPDGDALFAVLLTGPSKGTIDLETDGSFVYTPTQDFNGTDSFTYSVSDGITTSTATATVNVVSQDDRPVATDDSYEGFTAIPLSVSAEDGLLANDFDVDSEINASLIVDPENGSVTVNPDGSFTYISNDGFVGTDSFQYVVQDDSTVPLSDFGLVTIVVEEPVVVESDLVAFRLATTDLNGVEITEVSTGEAFELRVFVDDISEGVQQGVFAAFTDVRWESGLAAVTGGLTYGDAYPNGRIGDTLTPGLINEAGAIDGITILGGQERLLFSVPMQATSDGVITFTSDPADVLPTGDVSSVRDAE